MYGAAVQVEQPPGYAEVLPHVRRTLEVLFECDAEESVVAVATFVVNFRFEDGESIERWLPPAKAPVVARGRIMEAICNWISRKMETLDPIIPVMAQAGHFSDQTAKHLRAQLEQGTYRSSDPLQVLAEFLNLTVIELLGRDAAVLASALAGTLVAQEEREAIYLMVEQPPLLLSWVVQGLAEIQSKIASAVLSVYEVHLMTHDEAQKKLSKFFKHYTVQTATGTLNVHDTHLDAAFTESPFSVKLIDSFGSMMKLLRHIEDLVAVGETTIAVDFEGVKLCRHGALCLVQLTINDDPRLVYVLDVHLLGDRTFTMRSPSGTSLKGVLESEDIRKVWFDPRNDVDALYHQFGLFPVGIFDLQLAEVATRRRRGLQVAYLQGLHRCLAVCQSLNKEQQEFASSINSMGKKLFEPQNGGSYEIFQQRPLNPIILVYAAHDSRYMLELYEHFRGTLDEGWLQRVMKAGNHRGQWCLSREYILPSSDAPDI